VTGIDPADRARISAAVRAAEATTDGEIVPIVARRSDAYHDVALHVAVLAMLLVVAVLAALPRHGESLLDPLGGAVGKGWENGWTGGELLSALLVLLALAFLAVHYLTKPIRVRMVLAPAATKARRVRARAVLLFRTAIEARTATATGVLLYLSLAERRAEIVADAAILSRVDPAEWGEAMAALVDAVRDGRPGDGMVAAIERIGAVLAAHFPHSGTDPNELPDALIEL
jgi:putative membrane protein